MSDAQRKRAREEEEDLANSNGCMSFGEHRNKRVQCLPLRTSPRASQQWLPSSSITPQNSDSEDQVPQPGLWPWPSSMNLTTQTQQDAEMDMMDTSSPQAQHHAHPHRPDVIDLNPDNASGRVPTPILPSFAAQVRGQQCGWAGPGPAVKTMHGVVNLGHHQTGFSDDQCVPHPVTPPEGWQTIQNNRRLPSPISEGDDSMDTCAGSATTFNESVSEQSAPDLEYIAPQPSPPHAMEHPNAMMDVEAQVTDREEDQMTPSPNRRSHARNRHTINNWTWQPGMKKSFSIGYRSDCEKCRLKVPGHFNHIIIS